MILNYYDWELEYLEKVRRGDIKEDTQLTREVFRLGFVEAAKRFTKHYKYNQEGER